MSNVDLASDLMALTEEPREFSKRDLVWMQIRNTNRKCGQANMLIITNMVTV
jgi:hypothetical protein